MCEGVRPLKGYVCVRSGATRGVCMCEGVRLLGEYVSEGVRPLEGYVWLRLLKGHVCVRR